MRIALLLLLCLCSTAQAQRITFDAGQGVPQRTRIAFDAGQGVPVTESRERIEFDVGQSACRSPEPTVPAPPTEEPAERLEVWYASDVPGCVPCANLHRDIQRLPFRMEEAVRPKWARDAGITSAPLIWWKSSSGQIRYTTGYNGVDDLVRRIMPTMQPVTLKASGSHWTFPGDIRAHLKDPRSAHHLPAKLVDSWTIEQCLQYHDWAHAQEQQKAAQTPNGRSPGA